MSYTIQELKQDKAQLQADILKHIVAFEQKHNVEVGSVSTASSWVMGAECPKTYAVHVDVTV